MFSPNLCTVAHGLDFDLNLDKTINPVMGGQENENEVAWDPMEVSSMSIGDPHRKVTVKDRNLIWTMRIWQTFKKLAHGSAMPFLHAQDPASPSPPLVKDTH